MMIDLFSSQILPNTVPEEEGETAVNRHMQYQALSPLKGHKEMSEGTHQVHRRDTTATFAQSPIKVRMQNTDDDTLTIDSSRALEMIEDKRN